MEKDTANTILARVLRSPRFLSHPEIKPIFTTDGMSLGLADETADRLAAEAVNIALEWHAETGSLFEPLAARDIIDRARRRMKLPSLPEDQESLVEEIVKTAIRDFNGQVFRRRNINSARVRKRWHS